MVLAVGAAQTRSRGARLGERRMGGRQRVRDGRGGRGSGFEGGRGEGGGVGRYVGGGGGRSERRRKKNHSVK